MGKHRLTATQKHRVATRADWEAANRKVLEREQELTRLNDELAKERRGLPWLLIDKEYTFDTADGKKTLIDLFGARSQLLVYHMMFGPDWTAGCPACSALVDQLDGEMAHLNQHDVTMVVIAHAPIEKLRAYQKRMGWKFNYVSSFNSDFNYDFGVSFTDEQSREWAGEVIAQVSKDPMVAEMAASCGTDLEHYVTTEGPGLSAFILDDGNVYLTSGYPPDAGPSFMLGYQQLLQRTPKGYNDRVLLRRHDEYGRR
jgi:predicted dithiol-disulfide oxidoreductase (DUF899 family)